MDSQNLQINNKFNPIDQGMPENFVNPSDPNVALTEVSSEKVSEENHQNECETKTSQHHLASQLKTVKSMLWINKIIKAPFSLNQTAHEDYTATFTTLIVDMICLLS